MKFIFLVRPSTEPALSSSQRTGPHARARSGRRAHRVEHCRGSNEPRRCVRQRPEQLRRERERDHAADGIRSVSLSPVALSREVDIANPILLFTILSSLSISPCFLSFRTRLTKITFLRVPPFLLPPFPRWDLLSAQVSTETEKGQMRSYPFVARGGRQTHCEENERQKANL